MDGNHPKRRKDKYNPYTIGTTEDGRHWLTFSDGQGNRHHFEISAAVFALFDSFELDDLSYLNEVDRHYEQSELTEASLYDRPCIVRRRSKKVPCRAWNMRSYIGQSPDCPKYKSGG